MPAIIEMMDDIKSCKLDWIGNVYVGRIPNEAKPNVERTDILITESQNKPVEFGNDTFNAIYQEIAVEIFYGINIQKNIDELEINLMKKLESQGWIVSNSKNHFNDPDTNQVVKVILFCRQIELED